MNEDVISNIRSRVQRCRYLASMINDEKAARILRQMAADGEADIRRLETEADTPIDTPSGANTTELGRGAGTDP